jgi:hypothetical protein
VNGQKAKNILEVCKVTKQLHKLGIDIMANTYAHTDNETSQIFMHMEKLDDFAKEYRRLFGEDS